MKKRFSYSMIKEKSITFTLLQLIIFLEIFGKLMGCCFFFNKSKVNSKSSRINHMYAYIYNYINIYINIYIYTYTYIYIYTHTHTHTYVYTYIYTHILLHKWYFCVYLFLLIPLSHTIFFCIFDELFNCSAKIDFKVACKKRAYFFSAYH